MAHGASSNESESSKPSLPTDFKRFARFGVVDSSLLMISILAGFSLDTLIASRIGARGYGPIVGAGIGNAIADTVAGMPEGRWAAAGVGVGALAPLAPVVAMMALKRDLSSRPVALFVGGSCAAMFIGTFYHSFTRDSSKDKNS
eukprot:TRINITY_DN12672_c0_g1_i1.p1 TRINITY_DN12672_c0_g1~~TRINITY_DN12672_c0_g1_i1.p1  ORF type:complete len:165 (-),score=8.56 TRINITY_DN12672_c0_g1_i1:553-984(-)